MPQANPATVISPLTLPRPVAGYRRQVQISHDFLGIYNLLTVDTSWGENLQPVYTNYVHTPPDGSKQKAIHSQGTREIAWNISGELSSSSMGLLGLMQSESRGTQFNYIDIDQGIDDRYSFVNSNGYSLPWSMFTLNGSSNSALTFSLEGKSTQLPLPFSSSVDINYPDFPLPSWFSGNNFITSWSLSHTIQLNPKWRNDSSPTPVYYRPGSSEYTIQVTTAVELVEHTLIRFGLGSISLVEAVVTGRNRLLGDLEAPPRYEVTSVNARVSDQQAYLPSALVSILGGPTTAGFS